MVYKVFMYLGCAVTHRKVWGREDRRKKFRSVLSSSELRRRGWTSFCRAPISTRHSRVSANKCIPVLSRAFARRRRRQVVLRVLRVREFSSLLSFFPAPLSRYCAIVSRTHGALLFNRASLRRKTKARPISDFFVFFFFSNAIRVPITESLKVKKNKKKNRKLKT